ncbi:hypothetical protein I79_013633 [Cricetulus griseus]|uniref:Uncharacterized protein n=1 Tax=Cricetulus griseus TaxID=10029 RepID=G3HS08_CRIGR|nr:hypothetical protein I79_013633 [Cricetulus griseus]
MGPPPHSAAASKGQGPIFPGVVGNQPAAPQPPFPLECLGRMQAEREDELLALVAAAMVGI